MADEPTKKAAAYYRERAAEARTRAEAITEKQTRELMLIAAATWEFLANEAEKRTGLADQWTRVTLAATTVKHLIPLF